MAARLIPSCVASSAPLTDSAPALRSWRRIWASTVTPSFEIQSYIHRASGVSECAHGNEVDPGFSNGTNGVEVHAPTRFQFGSALNQFHRGTQIFETHVI